MLKIYFIDKKDEEISVQITSFVSILLHFIFNTWSTGWIKSRSHKHIKTKGDVFIPR